MSVSVRGVGSRREGRIGCLPLHEKILAGISKDYLQFAINLKYFGSHDFVNQKRRGAGS